MNLKGLPPARMSSLTVANRQTVSDITRLIQRGVKESTVQAQSIAPLFKGRNREDTCYRIWKYLKSNVRNKKEPGELQTVKTLSRLLLVDKHGDCKHYTTAVAAICKALRIPVHLRLVSFNYWNSQPTHIYAVAYSENGSPIYVDCVLDGFNEEPGYKHKTDVQC